MIIVLYFFVILSMTAVVFLVLGSERRITNKITETRAIIKKNDFAINRAVDMIEKASEQFAKISEVNKRALAEEKKSFSDDIDSVMKYSPSRKQRMKQKREDN